MHAHERPAPFPLRQVNHVLFHAQSERAEVQWICRGRERHFVVPEQAVHFAAADGEEHVRIARVARTHRYLMMLIPPSHLEQIVASEGCDPPGNLQPMVGRHDPVLQSCLTRLAAIRLSEEACSSLSEAEASRQLVLRLAELNGCGRPDWSRDESVFDARSMRHFVDFIDANLRLGPTLEGMGMLIGLSPSHFARKFRLSTGLSLQRFVNRRRVNRSLEILRTKPESLSSVALDLGFSSQSHFTNLFSSLTGMTPAKYRKQFGRKPGGAGEGVRSALKSRHRWRRERDSFPEEWPHADESHRGGR